MCNWCFRCCYSQASSSGRLWCSGHPRTVQTLDGPSILDAWVAQAVSPTLYGYTASRFLTLTDLGVDLDCFGMAPKANKEYISFLPFCLININ